jgi:hypothetical protein
MVYFLAVFSPETYEAFTKSSRDVAGFRANRYKAANRVHVGDRLICYVTKLSIWVGVLEVVNSWYTDATPLFQPENDAFVLRFEISTLAWLDKEKAIDVRSSEVWDALSFTKGRDKNSPHWTGKMRANLGRLDNSDGQVLEHIIMRNYKQ